MPKQKEQKNQNKTKIKFYADKIKITGPLVDDSFSVNMNVGEYIYQEIMQLPTLNNRSRQIAVEVYLE